MKTNGSLSDYTLIFARRLPLPGLICSYTELEKVTAPGMQVQLLSENHGRKEYAVIFSKGDEAFSGLNEFAEKFHVTSAHFTAIGVLRGATLAWFSSERTMY